MSKNQRERNRSSIFLNILLIFSLCFFSKILPASFGRITADACGYLDIMRNILSGHGPVISYNLYQKWSGNVFYPALPYMQPLFSIVIIPIFYIFKSIAAINIFNVILSAANSVILYGLLHKRFNPSLAFWSAILVGISPSMIHTSVFPWTEQLHLFLLLISLLFLLSGLETESGKKMFIAGAISSINCLTRFANLYVIFSILLALLFIHHLVKNINKRSLFLFFLGLVLPLFLYELFCVLRYHEFYPAYSRAAYTFNLAERFPGAYYKTAGTPILNMPERNTLDQLSLLIHNVPHHIEDFLDQLGGMSFLIIPIIFYIFYQTNPVEIILLMLLAGNIFGYSLNFYFLSKIEILRYSLIPYVAIIPLVLILTQGIGKILKERFKFIHPKTIFFISVTILLTIYMKDVFHGNIYFYDKKFVLQQEDYKKQDLTAFHFIEEHSTPTDLIATDHIQGIFPLNRPTVSLPPEKSVTLLNLKDYLQIYRPKFILTITDNYDEFLIKLGYHIGFHEEFVNVWTKNAN
ncbi:MAG: glycosyltransferase family 39 protein [Candidatus Omnitrophica bacterium]|nr:glycosyltransferase family 39 protein [Candidatus Omnitrophota bacterium]